VLDPRFAPYRLNNAAVERIATGFRWAEGPVWFGDLRCLLWSDIPNDRMMRWVEETGEVSVCYGILVNYEGHRAPFELPASVYRLDPATGAAEAVITGMARPNGLCFSPDESLLYVVDTGVTPRTILVFEVVDGRRVARGRVFADMSPGTSDGVRCDTDGNLWAAAGGGGDGFDGVHVFAPDGARLGQVLLPEKCANLCFGGVKRNRLFMAASQSIYALYVEAQGVPGG
jgi:gluconolactonase